MKPTFSSIRLSALVTTAIIVLASCGEKPASPKETKPAAAAKPVAGQAAKTPEAPKPKEINLAALLLADDLKKVLALDAAAKVGVNAKDKDKGIIKYGWLRPDHEEIQKKNDELLKKIAADEAAGKTVAPEDQKPHTKHFVVLLDYGKAFASQAAAKKNLEARRNMIAKKVAEAKTPEVLEDMAGIADGAFWRADVSTLVFAKGTRVVMVGTGGADTAKAKDWALAVAKEVAAKLP